tara:strand:+ start:715 stop:963 length:249 start_codon:yes stop_codon:yes gene_type:complete
MKNITEKDLLSWGFKRKEDSSEEELFVYYKYENKVMPIYAECIDNVWVVLFEDFIDITDFKRVETLVECINKLEYILTLKTY